MAELARNRYGYHSGSTALVPGCGRAYDAIALAQHGFAKVVAVDISKAACAAARALIAKSAPGVSSIEVVNANFFEHATERLYDFIWDCTFLCALDPFVRKRWASKMRSLLSKGGILMTCIFPLSDTRKGGPPYRLTVPIVSELLTEAGFEPIEIRASLPPEECHKPGGFTGSDGTALATWRLRISQL